MPDEPKKKPEELRGRLDAFVAKVVSDPSKPQETLLLTGFLGASSEANHTRIYTDATLETYVDVPNGDIVATEPVSPDQAALGGQYIWVKKDADVVQGKMGTERKKAKFLEGPIAAQAAAGVGTGVGAALPPTQPFILCHPTLVVQFCPTHAPVFCPSHAPVHCPTHFPHLCPTHLPQLCPSHAPIFCPPSLLSPICPTRPVVCNLITVNQQQCVASGGGFGCPVDTPQTPQTPQFGNIGMQAAGMGAQEQAAIGGVQQFPHSILCNTGPVQCPPTSHCPSVPVWHCPTKPVICYQSAYFACHQTIFQPQCNQVYSAFCPVGTAACPDPFGGVGGFAGGVAAYAAAPEAGAAIPPQTFLPALCVHPSVYCPTHFLPACPTFHGYHCPSVNHYHCITQQCTVPPQCHITFPPAQCPSPFCPSVAQPCITQQCTVPPQCIVQTAPPHCPVHTPLCPSVAQICVTQQPQLCVASPNCPGPGPGTPVFQPGAPAQGFAAEPMMAAFPRTFIWWQCFGGRTHFPCTPNCPR